MTSFLIAAAIVIMIPVAITVNWTDISRAYRRLRSWLDDDHEA